MTKRQRVRLVPEDAIEILEIRIALYFNNDGTRQVRAVVSSPEDPDLPTVDLVELRGALDYGRDRLLNAYEAEA